MLQLEDGIVSIIKKQSCKHGLSTVWSALHHKIVLKDGVCKEAGATIIIIFITFIQRSQETIN